MSGSHILQRRAPQLSVKEGQQARVEHELAVTLRGRLPEFIEAAEQALDSGLQLLVPAPPSTLSVSETPSVDTRRIDVSMLCVSRTNWSRTCASGLLSTRANPTPRTTSPCCGRSPSPRPSTTWSVWPRPCRLSPPPS
jgi:hypothetical protein